MSLREKYTQERLLIPHGKEAKGVVKWRSPSNIALVKYWGKHGIQLPSNPSISFTLNAAFTETKVTYETKNGTDQEIVMDFFFDGHLNEVFGDRIKKYLTSLLDIYPFLGQLKLRVESTNSFPHSSGIASSASGLSAMALCLTTIEHRLFGTLDDDEEYHQKTSYLARLGSGSACRSIFSKAALWGHMLKVEGSSDEYAVSIEDQIHPVFKDYRDSILIVSTRPKKKSSSMGHALMETHAYAQARFQQARQHTQQLMQILQEGNTELFAELVENEAMTLHGLMMSSPKAFTLMEPGTLEIIDHIYSFRRRTGIPICFTLDAGPNIHLLYPNQHAHVVRTFVESELTMFCSGGRWIDDHVGEGPVQEE